jgi:hypothetical protein
MNGGFGQEISGGGIGLSPGELPFYGEDFSSIKGPGQPATKFRRVLGLLSSASHPGHRQRGPANEPGHFHGVFPWIARMA